MKIKIIGDAHGELRKYKKAIKDCHMSICVGDFGFKKEWTWHIKNIGPNHWINPGNHDYMPMAVKDEYPSTGNSKYFEEYSIFTVRGADSIDKHHRVEGKTFFSNEEMSYAESLQVVDNYLKIKPKIVVSHDCPQRIMSMLFGYTDKSTTRQALQAMLDDHKPDFWIFGHHHHSLNEIIDGVRFICLDELEQYIFNFNDINNG
jgi:predicted phosphodiesterase